jgi:uncharacterized membrane protein
MNVHDVLDKAESVRAADRPAAGLAAAVRKALRGRWLDGVLRGRWLGHPVHPLVVTVPIGAWVSAAVLDLCGQRAAARYLVATGLLATPAAALAGLADFGELTVEQRRVGLLHASANAVGAAVFVRSYARRVQGRHAAGAFWTAVGLAVVSAGGALGGHLSYAQGAGVRRWTSGRGDGHAGSSHIVSEADVQQLAESVDDAVLVLVAGQARVVTPGDQDDGALRIASRTEAIGPDHAELTDQRRAEIAARLNAMVATLGG